MSRSTSSSPTPTVTKEAAATVYGNNAVFDALVREALDRGVKMTPEEVLRIWRLADISRIPGLQHDICWIDQGGEAAGWKHMLKHKDEFATNGIPEGKLKELAQAATQMGKYHGPQSKKKSSRIIFSLWFNGQPVAVAISVGSNGYVVGMNRSSLKTCRERAGLSEEDLNKLLRQKHFWS